MCCYSHFCSVCFCSSTNFNFNLANWLSSVWAVWCVYEHFYDEKWPAGSVWEPFVCWSPLVTFRIKLRCIFLELLCLIGACAPLSVYECVLIYQNRNHIININKSESRAFRLLALCHSIFSSVYLYFLFDCARASKVKNLFDEALYFISSRLCVQWHGS